MSLDAMKQALELLESAHVATDLVWKRYDCITALRAAIEQMQEPVAWVYPQALEAFKKGNPWVAYGSNGDGPHCDGVQRIPLYLHNAAVAQRPEPCSSGSGAGFESLPASPNQPEKNNG